MEAEHLDAGREAATVARHRRVLMLLPPGYRRQHGEEILAVLLDAARDEGRDRPALGEIVGIASLSLRLRVGALRTTSRTAVRAAVRMPRRPAEPGD